MRLVAIMLVLLAALAGGYFAYQHLAPRPVEAPTPTAPARPLAAEDCTADRAVYEFAGDPRFTLRLVRIPSPPGATTEMAEAFGHRVGNVNFVVHVSAMNLDVTLKPDNTRPLEGDAYVLEAAYVKAANGARVRVHMFDSNMRYIADLPRHDTAAPAFIYMPDLMPLLIAHHIDLPPRMFKYAQCENPPAAPATTMTP
ncbi:MAG TPA: hypothetical protein VG841_05890 [Caulobacterales bacterium]|nr:hypothetical protein [Caulobacterales bacterium]